MEEVERASPGTEETVELRFPLDVEEGWPPVAVEGLPFSIGPAGYVSTTPPLFVKSLSVGDVITVEVGEDGLVASWHHVCRSTRSVVWLLRISKTDEIGATLTHLREMGCNTVSLLSAGCHSVDIPGRVPIGRIDAILKHLDPEKVAVAYPSFRHSEGDSQRGLG